MLHKIADILVPILVIISLGLFTIETIPDIYDQYHVYINLAETIIMIIFSVEYIWRIYDADNKIKYIFSFYGIIDLLTIIPFWMPVTDSLQTARILRLLRIVRLFKSSAFNSALIRLGTAINSIKEELVMVGATTSIMLYLSGVGIYYFEHAAQPAIFVSVGDGLWWAVVTLTTVGYGDMYPITIGGRFFACLTILIGLGIVAVPTGLLASALSDARRKKLKEKTMNEGNKDENENKKVHSAILVNTIILLEKDGTRLVSIEYNYDTKEAGEGETEIIIKAMVKL